jgi:hypothetical protein
MKNKNGSVKNGAILPNKQYRCILQATDKLMEFRVHKCFCHHGIYTRQAK